MPDTMPFRIFIVDDDVDLLMLLERRLERAGYLVETAASLREAEELRHDFQPDIYLIDINVDGEDGRRLCWTIKMQEGLPGVRVLLVTGYDCHHGRASLFGADEVLAKPLPTEYLLLRLQYHTGEVLSGRLKGV